MFETLNSAGYDLHCVSTNEWIFNVKGTETIVAGSFALVTLHMVLKAGFSIEEIEEGVNAMLALGHDGIHFGMYKGWIFTFEKDARKTA